MAYSLTSFVTPPKTNSCTDIFIDIILKKNVADSNLARLRIESFNGNNSFTYIYPSGFVSASEAILNGVTTYTLRALRKRTSDTENKLVVRTENFQEIKFTNNLAPISWRLDRVFFFRNFLNAQILKPNGNTLSNLDRTVLDLKYSLDNITYNSSVPQPQTNGNYILYAKDTLGCIFSEAFTITSQLNYTLETFNISESSTPCNTVLIDLEIKRALADSALDKVFIQNANGFLGQNYSYPDDFITSSSSEAGGFVTYILQLEKNRSTSLLHFVSISTVSQQSSIFLDQNIPVKWILSSINVISIQLGFSTASGFLIKSNSEELTGAEKSAIGIQASLNGLDYGVNTIPGLEDGNYNYYVKDNFGCEQNLDFLVGDAIDENPEIFVSLLNSVSFAKRNRTIPSGNPLVSFDNENFTRNPENQLSYEDQTDTNYKDWFNKYPVGQDLRFQYQSSYKDNKAFLIKDENELIELNVNQLTDNRNVKDIRDGRAFYNGTDLFVFFPEGSNIYNETGDVIGVNFLNGSLLSYNEIGTFIDVADIGVLRITGFKTISLDSINYEAMELDYSSNQGNFSLIKKITTTFTKQKFDYYEFQINGFLLGCYQIAICDSNNFDEQNPLESAKYLSERILIINDLSKHHYIEWFNTENNQIGWSTGIKSKIYLPFVMPPTFEPEGENDVYSTDTSQFLLESEAFENYNFHFDLLPLAIARQIQLLLSNDNLLIDDLNYVKKETPEIEPQEGSNLYLVRPKLSRSTNYNSNSNLGQTINNNPSTIDGSKGILKLN